MWPSCLSFSMHLEFTHYMFLSYGTVRYSAVQHHKALYITLHYCIVCSFLCKSFRSALFTFLKCVCAKASTGPEKDERNKKCQKFCGETLFKDDQQRGGHSLSRCEPLGHTLRSFELSIFLPYYGLLSWKPHSSCPGSTST